jgi:FKBP-type peptidyl-prolyl cis-trans isomerase
MVPVVLPGSKRAIVVPEHEQAQALGEQASRGTIQAPTRDATADPSITLAEPTEIGKSRTTVDQLKYETIRAGTGAQAKTGSRVTVHYDGTLTSGAPFDSSRGKNQPLSFRIGVDHDLIRGWHIGISGMRVGEIRRLTIPPELAYKERGYPGRIPPNATLMFEIELLAVAE